MTTVVPAAPRGERVFVDVGNKSAGKKPAVALRLEQAALSAKKEQKSLEEKLFEAEVRREIEIEAIKYKAAQSAALSSSAKAPGNEENSADVGARRLTEKICKAAERREACLSAKKAKAEEMSKKKDASLEDNDKKKATTTKASTTATTPTASSSSRSEIDAKLNHASARKAELTYRKIEAAAALGTERCLTAAIARLKAEAADESARSDLKTTLEMNLSETARRKELLLADVVQKASRSGAGRVAAVAERLEIEKEQRKKLLKEKMDKAAKLKKERDDKVQQAATSSTGKVVKAKTFREANDQGRRVALQDTLDAKSDKASQRREMETLDKVVKAASLGSTAVLNATAKRDSHFASTQLVKENRLETKLEAHAKRYEKSKTKIIEKASKQNEKVADVQKFKALTSDQDNEGGGAFYGGGEGVAEGVVVVQKAQAPPQTSASAATTPSKKAENADRRRELATDTKVVIATQLGSERVKAVLNRKAKNDEEDKKIKKNILDDKLKAAADRRAKQIESTRRGLNGKRNPNTVLPPLSAEQKNDDDEYLGHSYTIIGAAIGAALAVFGACVARFSS